jgi:hypothetical protein
MKALTVSKYSQLIVLYLLEVDITSNEAKAKHSIAEHFNDIKDIRIERGKKHKLIDIITISICAVVCGADGWEEIELYSIIKEKWLGEFLELPNGISSHDTFAAGRVSRPSTSIFTN